MTNSPFSKSLADLRKVNEMPLLDTNQKRRRVVFDHGRPTFRTLAELKAAEAAGLVTRPTLDADPLDPSGLTVETEEEPGKLPYEFAEWEVVGELPGINYGLVMRNGRTYIIRQGAEQHPGANDPGELVSGPGADRSGFGGERVLGSGDRARGAVDRRRLELAAKRRQQRDQVKMRSWNDANRRHYRLPPIGSEAA